MRILASAAALTIAASAVTAQTARLSVIHGVPGLAAPVEVVANGTSLFQFDYTDVRGPLVVDAGPITIDLWVNGSSILSQSVTLDPGLEYSVIAHLSAAGMPMVSLFEDDMSPIAGGESRVTVRHTAQAPAVDVAVDTMGMRALTIGNLSNPNEAAADVPAGSYMASLLLAGTANVAFGPVPLDVDEDVSYRVYAVGDVSQPDFTLVVQPIDFSPAGAHARISVLHGVPGLAGPVDVVADGATLFSFDYTDVEGPFEVPAGPTQIDIQLGGTTILSANVVLDNGGEYSAIAHLTAAGMPTIALFEEDRSPIAPGEARVTIRHTAQAPAVDIGIDQMAMRVLTVPGLTNPNEAAVDVPVGSYDATIFLAGTTNAVFGPINLMPEENVSYQLYAVGNAANTSFTVLVQAVDFAPEYTVTTAGTACAGAISASVTSVATDAPFDVQLSGAASSAMGVLFIGVSDTAFAGSPLPLDLGVIGATGCSFYTDGRFAVPAMTDGSGAAASTLTIGPETARFLPDVFFQWAFASPNNAFGFEFTDYLQVVRN